MFAAMVICANIFFFTSFRVDIICQTAVFTLADFNTKYHVHAGKCQAKASLVDITVHGIHFFFVGRL
jgi:hypothetical protein